MTLTAGTRLGAYEIHSLLGAGGMGVVYRARDNRLNRDVAIKVLAEGFGADPERLRRFEHEARAAAALNHPNLLAVYDVGRQPNDGASGAPYIVSECLDGATLRQRLADGPLAVRQALDYAGQIAQGLRAAHDKGIVHRDLKPENLFVTTDGRVKILDFGLAKLTETDGASASASPTRLGDTVPGVVLGTIGYMAPEQVRGLAADARADIFALGAILYEMLSGQRAFHGETSADTMTAILKETPSDLTSGARPVPTAVARIVDRCLAKEPSGRFQSAGDLAFALEGLTTRSGEGDVIATTVSPTRARSSRLPWTVAGALAVAVVALALPAFQHLTRPAIETPELRLEVTTPATNDPVSLAFSPDGRMLVFVASPQGTPQLWLRRLELDSTKAEPLTGTERASWPFWSPDSRSIGFFADGKVKRLDLAGGPAKTLFPTLSSFRGSAWNDQAILVARGSHAISRASVNSGEPAPLLRLAPGQIAHYFPRFLPDGQHFLYTVNGTPVVRGIYVGSIDGSAGTRLLSDFSAAFYASPGFLLFVRGGVLLAKPFDASRVTVSGEPVRLAEDVAYSANTGAAAVSTSSDGRIAYRVGTPGPVLAWFDRSNRDLGVVTKSDRVGPLGPELSPNGQRLLFFKTVDDNRDIFYVDVARGITERVTTAESQEGWPVWSPEGNEIAFSSNRNGKFALYRKSPSSTSTEDLLFESPRNNCYSSDWSSDGRFLLFWEIAETTGMDLWALSLTDRKPISVLKTEFDERYAQFSPDGHWVAFQSNESGQDEIYIQPFEPGEKVPVSSGGGAQVRWNRNGRELFYLAPDRRLMSVSLSATAGGNGLQPSSPREVFPTRIWNTVTETTAKQEYVVSPDGKRFLMLVDPPESPAPPITVIMNWRGGSRP